MEPQTESATDPQSPTLIPSQIFAGKRVVVVGGTGFLGKVWVSMFLHRFPELGHIYLMVRPKGDQSAEERFWSEVVTSPVFDPIREQHPGAKFEAFIREKISPVAGDVSKVSLGFADDLLAELKGNTAAVVNVAGVVDFNPPLDEALDVNAFGVNNIIELARQLGNVGVMHTSTCYVAGYRTGPIAEVDPRDVPFPRAEGAERARLIAPPSHIPVDRYLDRKHWNPQNEIKECLDIVAQARHRCEDAFRQSTFLDEAKKNLLARGEPCRGTVLEEELANVKRRFVRTQLSDAGKERALYWGWPNIYTYTKSIGEQVLMDSGVPATIVRPAVVESSSTYPFPSWNEGINTSAPLIYMVMKGQVQFPADPNVNLDFIPVDMVTSGMIAALAELIDGSHKPVYQFGTTDTNPCRATRFLELIGLYKRKKLQDGGDEGNRLLNAIGARIEPVAFTKNEYQSHGAHALARTGRSVASVVDGLRIGPFAGLAKGLAKSIRSASRAEDKLGEVLDVFLPFIAECDWIFSCANTRHAIARMPPEERERFYWEPEKIDLRVWMHDIHIPGIEKWSVPELDIKTAKKIKALRHYETLLDLLDEMADRHDHAVALRFLEEDGEFSRMTYLQWREAAATTAARLAELGIVTGDRVMLSCENRPAWPVAYFGILRAGAVVVPVDPKLTAAQMINVLRSSGAKATLLGNEVDRLAGEAIREALPDLAILDIDEATIDDRSLDPPAVELSPSDLASIIYTSGTTGDPKGVMLTHENFASLLAALTPLFSLTPSDGVLSVLPLHHTFEFSCGLMLPMSRGATINYIGEITADRLSEGLEKGRISAMVGVPALWQMLERKITQQVKDRGIIAEKGFDIALELNRMLGTRLGVNAGKVFFGAVHHKLGGRVKYLISGGSALPKSTAQTFAGLGLKLTEGYGLTEAAPVLTVATASARSRCGQVGKSIPGVEIRIAAADKEGVGEVLARGPNVMRGYFDNDSATREAIDDEGWLHTGDLGKLDKRGQLVLSGRSDDVIVTTSGENVYPDDVQDMLGPLSHIDEYAIVGVDDPDRETELVACIAVPEMIDGVTREAARSRALRSMKDGIAKLPRRCQPTVVEIYDAELPKTATRKVKRSEAKRIIERLMKASAALRASEREGNTDGSTSSKDNGLTIVKLAVASITSRDVADVAPMMTLSGDLGMDSLMSMELTVAIEKQLGCSLDTEQLALVETVQDVVNLVGRTRPARARTQKIETFADDEAIPIPSAIATTAKTLMGKAQMAFYRRVMQSRVFGRSFLPHNRNTIVISNHSSHLDMGFVKYALGGYGEDMVSLAAQDYFFKGRWRKTYFEQLTNLAPFDRRGGLRQGLRQASEPIREGKTVLLFPEGTRSTDGVVQEFKPALGHLALSCAVDILPVYLKGTYEALPKGSSLPKQREISAHIGPPLKIADLRRLTEGMKFTAACRAIAKLAHAAVVTLQRGGVLDLSEFADIAEALGEKREHPLVGLFRELQDRYVEGSVKKTLTFYFSLGQETEAKWTAVLAPDSCHIELGKPKGAAADCVLKTNPEIFTKMIREAYMPTPVEIMSGMVKSNDVSLLATFQEAFDIR